MAKILLVPLEALGLFITATLAFDAIHWTLHQAMKSRWRLVRWVGGLHQSHHAFFDAELRFHDDQQRRNLLWHIMPEYATQMGICALGFLLLDPIAVALVMGLFTVLFVAVLFLRGKDRNHVSTSTLAAAHEAFWVKATYHSLHHVYPDCYMSSYVTVFDRLAGTACALRGRKVALTGASGAFGGALRTRLERAGAEVLPMKHGEHFDEHGCSDEADAILARAEILALCHGSKGEDAMAANCDSFVALIERFKVLAAGRLVPPEVWALGSEIECHPAFGVAELKRYARSKRAFAVHAAGYFHDPSLQYRHIVPSAFTSRMGPGLMSGGFAAGVALWLIRRGFRYVPVTYTGVAFVNFAPFLARALKANRRRERELGDRRRLLGTGIR